MRKFLVVCACAALCTASANAGLRPASSPQVDQVSNGGGSPVLEPGGRASANDFSDGFEAYPLGEFCEGGGWEEWTNGNGGVCGQIVDDPAIDTKSLVIFNNDDMVQVFDITSGIWELRTWMYVSSDFTGRNFIIMLNTYPTGNNWSLQLGYENGNITNLDDPNSTLPLILDEWVETVVYIDLPEDLVQVYYGGVQFVFDRTWKDGASGNGESRIQCLDLFGDSGSTGVAYDNITLKQQPDPVGACCDPESKECVDEVPRGDCSKRFTANTLCADLDPACGFLPDECSRAAEMGADDEVLFSNREATWTFKDFPMCFGGGDQATRTMWFKFTATENFTRVRTCGTPLEGGATDTLVSVFPSGPNGECLEFEPDLGCSDDGCGFPFGRHGEVCVATIPGEVYHIMVGSKPGTRAGMVSLETSSHAECPPPTEGACCASDQNNGSEFCFDSNTSDCFNLPGYYTGDGTRCADDECLDCNPECAEGQDPEGGFCGFNTAIDTNPGCNRPANPAFTPLVLDQVICGLSSSDGGPDRDSDWFSIELEAGTTYEMVVNADFPALTGFAGYEEGLEGSGDCADTSGNISPGGNQGVGESIVEFTPVADGTYFAYVAVSRIGGQAIFLRCCSGTNGYTAVVRVAAGGCVRSPAWQCDGDVDGNGVVNPVDLGLVQAAFGSTDEQDLCNYDMDCNGFINPVDGGLVQAQFGLCNDVPDVCP